MPAMLRKPSVLPLRPDKLHRSARLDLPLGACRYQGLLDALHLSGRSFRQSQLHGVHALNANHPQLTQPSLGDSSALLNNILASGHQAPLPVD